MRQLELFSVDNKLSVASPARVSFSHENVNEESARLMLEEKYEDILYVDNRFNRKIVSYQANKGEIVHGWIKYREGFSANLVEILMNEFGIEADETVLDPFAGSSTVLLVAKTKGINAVGLELLPVCHLAWDAKSRFYDYDLDELNEIKGLVEKTIPEVTQQRFPHLKITETAFSDKTENDLVFFTDWVEKLSVSENSKILLRLILTSVLEEISYTRKDGQYLRWDYRSQKIIDRNNARKSQGKKLIKKVDKGDLPTVKDAIISAISIVLSDIRALQQFKFTDSSQKLIKGNTLFVLPELNADQFSAVITSPPYCNRYDYTRTYALELAYLDIGNGIFDLRQSLLSCTVENRSKLDILREHYAKLGKEQDFERILHVVNNNSAFQEIVEALNIRWDRGDMNNKGVLRMVEQYFIELSFVFAELFRTCKKGARVAFVNDNVRYGGEIIPVDLLSTNLAEQLGFKPIQVYVLPQRKGNSSQQMGKFGREALRKSITIWEKP